MKKRNFVLRGFDLAARISSRVNPSPLAKFRTADKPVSESRNHASGSEVMTGASAKEFQDAGEGLGVRGKKTVKTGFTLAEVLITLVIIGVIGALTVPALIQNTQKQEYVSALKKMNAALSQAVQQIITEEGVVPAGKGGWAENPETILELLKKQLNTIKDCTKEQCANVSYKGLNGGNPIQLSDRTLILADGAKVKVDWQVSGTCYQNYGAWKNGSTDFCAGIYVDINGNKGPNQFGRDAFGFVLKENGIYPSGCDKSGYCENTLGYGCACKVLTEGAMNY